MELPFATLDVFTTKKFEGNPLAIVRVPAALRSRLTQSMKQKIATEFNLSETVFLHDDTSRCGPEARDMDIFTSVREIPFAGHPTIGTAVYSRHYLPGGTAGSGSGDVDAEVKELVTKAGRIELEPLSSLPGGIQARIPHDVHLHAATFRTILATATGDKAAKLQSGLHTTASQAVREAELDAPIFSIVNGMTFVLVRLSSLEELAQAKPSRLEVDELVADFLDEGWRNSLVGRYYYVDMDGNREREDEEEGRGGSALHLRTRMMGEGIEDPATGSAASALAAYLTLTLTLTRERRAAATAAFRITQGVEMGRRSVISVETTTAAAVVEEKEKAEGGDEQQQQQQQQQVRLVDVKLGGTAVVVMHGTITVGDVDAIRVQSIRSLTTNLKNMKCQTRPVNVDQIGLPNCHSADILD
ncbi:Diaminopimelate epimerase-like protein [Xylariaceae sp. FL0594]|nr:Diaminopimelate epimerase-like protein [Xylariaceae sp. FL0594]